ncbi:hypothetical protein BT69DRAFT_1298354 [Atractiella rhizophila]|nr:hypothetical protein BT69DRAFT_1298354 [Atractiella rhizophila]
MATMESFLGLGKRTRTSVDIAKRNNEDGTALSQFKRRKDQEYETKGPACNVAYIPTRPKSLASLLEDDEEPVHRAFSLWTPTVTDIGGKQGLVAFRALWHKLLQIDTSLVPAPLLDTRKSSICAIASRIHSVLVAEGHCDEVGEMDLDYDPTKDQTIALGDDEEDPLGMDIDGDELAKSLEQNKKMDPKGKKSTRTTNSMSCQVPVSTLDPLLRDSTSTMNADQVQNHVLSKKRNPVWLFYTVISKSEAHPDVQNGHIAGTTYVKCNHCRWTHRITKSSNGKLTHLEDHLTGSPRHFKKTGRFFKLLRKKYEDKVAITEDERKMAMNHTPILEEDAKRSGKQLDIIEQLQGMAARFGDQAFDQTKFDQLLVDFFVATDQPFQLAEDPHFRDLLHYLQYTYPTMKPEHAAIPAKGTSWNSDDEAYESAHEEEVEGESNEKGR